MTKYQIAEKLGVSHQAVYHWYNGKTIPTTKNLIQLSKILKVPIEGILASFKQPEKKTRK
jgi:transcriptional regulator with XRE-family HTH domain